MTIKEDKEYQPAATATDLEATQLVSLDDFEELEYLPLTPADAAEPAKPHRTVIAAGIVFGLILATILFLTVLLVRSGGH